MAAGVFAQEPAKKPAPTGKRATPPVIVAPRLVIEGGLFKRTVVPGISELREAVAGLALVDINKDGLIDIVAVTAPRPEVRTRDDQDRLRVWLNKGGLRFEPHTIQIRGSKLTCQQFGHAAVIPNLVDFNGDGFWISSSPVPGHAATRSW